jgi:CO/xanthine dehydrogenase Mo-binding subunit
VRFIGDGVAAVAAVDEDTAIRALELIQVRVRSTDTDLVPVDLGAYSSRETFIVGNARASRRRARSRPLGKQAIAEESVPNRRAPHVDAKRLPLPGLPLDPSA